MEWYESFLWPELVTSCCFRGLRGKEERDNMNVASLAVLMRSQISDCLNGRCFLWHESFTVRDVTGQRNGSRWRAAEPEGTGGNRIWRGQVEKDNPLLSGDGEAGIVSGIMPAGLPSFYDRLLNIAVDVLFFSSADDDKWKAYAVPVIHHFGDIASNNNRIYMEACKD